MWYHKTFTKPCRWEKYAPGPVRPIGIEVARPPARPLAKRDLEDLEGQPARRGRGRGGSGRGRGRPRKHPVEDQSNDPNNLGAKPKVKAVKPDLEAHEISFEEAPVVDGDDVMEQAVTADDAAVPEAADVAAPSSEAAPLPDGLALPDVAEEKTYGCPRCYFSPNGCSTCRRPGYTPRGSRKPGAKASAKAKATAKAKAKSKPVAKHKVKKQPGRPRKPGRAARVSA